MNIEFVLIDKIIPYARNQRKHSDDQVKKIASSIREFGFKNPVIVDKNMSIIAGHGRVLAAEKLGLDKVPVIVADDLSDAQVKAYRIADNKTGDLAEWDFEMLKLEFTELEGLNFNLEMTGFDAGEMTSIFFEPDFAPGTEADQGALDSLKPQLVSCPHCGQEFDLREHS